jgi:uncharacterized membrane protein YcaP (DUF421 family)
MGKRQLGEMQPFELVIMLIFADLATIPMAETALPLIHGIIPILTLAVLHYLLSFLSRKSIFLRKIINGKPQIVISPNGIEYSTLKQLDLNMNDLIEGIRGCGYFNLEEILYAIIQTNGTITVLPRGAYAPLTANDIKLEKEKASLPIIVFAEGKFIHENMNIAKIDEGFLNTKIENAGFKKLTEILLITLNTQGKMYIQPKNGPFVIIETEYKGEGKW